MTEALGVCPPELLCAGGLARSPVVHLWHADTRLAPAALDLLHAQLHPEEQQRIAGYRMPEKRVESVVARGLLRYLLAQFLEVPAQGIGFVLGPHGKPHVEVAGGAPLHFNVSHTTHRVVIAISGSRRVGVDVEHIRASTPCSELAKRFFTPQESAAIAALPEGLQREAFFRCWTRKEAVLKAAGHGISAGLDTFDVPVDPRGEPFELTATHDGVCEKWAVCDVHPGAAYVASLAVEGDATPVQQWVPPPQLAMLRP